MKNSSYLEALPPNLKEGIVSYVLENSNFINPSVLFPEQLKDLNHLTEKRIWAKRWLNLKHPHHVKKCIQHRDLVRQLVLLDNNYSAPEPTGSDDSGLPADMAEFFNVGWPSITGLNLLFIRRLDFTALLASLEANMPRLSRLDIRIDVYKLPYILQLIGSSSLLISDLSIHAIYPSSTIANHKVDTEAAQAMDSFCHGRGFCTLEIPNCVVGPKFFDAVLTHKSRCLQTLRMSVTLRSTYLSSIQQPTAPLTRLTFTNVHIENEFSQIGLQSKHFPYLRELCINSITTPLPDITVVHTQRLFNSMFASPWPRLEKVQLPYMTDEVAAMVARNCPNLEFLDICSKYTHINLSHHLVDLTNQNQRFLTDRGFLDLVGSLERLKVLIIGNPYETCHHVVTGAVTQRPVIDRWVCKKLGHLEIVDWDVVPTDIDSVKSVFPRLFISTTFISNLAQNIAAPSNDGGEVSEAAGWMSQLLSRSWGLFEGVGRRVGRRIMHLLW